MKLITNALITFFSLALLNEDTIYDDPALQDIIRVRDEQNSPNFVLVSQNENSFEFAVESFLNEQNVATHILSLEKNAHGKDCIVLSFFDGNGDILGITKVVLPKEKLEDRNTKESLLLKQFNLVLNVVTSFENLVERCFSGQEEFFIAVGGAGRSSKHIVLCDDEINSLDLSNLPADLELSVYNEIDESEDIVNRNTIGEKTNIMEAIEKNAMFAY